MKVTVTLTILRSANSRKRHRHILNAYFYNDEELKAFIEGIHKARNGVVQSRT